MLFRRDGNRRRRSPRHVRLRLESCVNTILELNDKLGEGKIKSEVIRQFVRLRETITHLNDDAVAEEDINKIEQATNDLLAEIQMAYREAREVQLGPKDCH